MAYAPVNAVITKYYEERQIYVPQEIKNICNNICNKLNKTKMNKSKFKTVKFKPFDMELHYWNQEYWISHLCFGGDLNNFVKFTDSCIEAYPELFEVEKAEREFEEGAYYKARYRNQSLPEAVRYIFGKFFRTTDVLGSHRHYAETDFFKIGEKIEL